MSTGLWLDDLNSTLRQLLIEDDRIYLLGEDLTDPYGGAFKVTKGLSSQFPDRVLSTPISEAAITGVAIGMALQGFVPVVEIMFGDFLTLCTDQLINHLSKFEGLGKKVPLLLRTPMGAGRGYGPTHSQSLEKHFLGIPYLNVFAPSLWHSPGELLAHLISAGQLPALFLEHKLLYAQKFQTNGADGLFFSKAGPSAPIVVRNYSSGLPDVILISYGGSSLPVKKVMLDLLPEEIRIKAIFVAEISKPPIDFILSELEGSRSILIIEEGTEGFGWGSEIGLRLYQKTPHEIRIRTICSLPDIIPANREREKNFLPSPKRIIETIFEELC